MAITVTRTTMCEGLSGIMYNAGADHGCQVTSTGVKAHDGLIRPSALAAVGTVHSLDDPDDPDLPCCMCTPTMLPVPGASTSWNVKLLYSTHTFSCAQASLFVRAHRMCQTQSRVCVCARVPDIRLHTAP